MTLIEDIKHPPKIVVAGLYKDDSAVNDFIQTFNSELSNTGIIQEINKFDTIPEIGSYFKTLKNRCDYNSVMIVTHGRTDTGDPTYGETTQSPGELDEILENPIFLNHLIGNALEDCLVFLASCYSGNKGQVGPYLSESLAWHCVTPFPGTALTTRRGAKAMALFLRKMNEAQGIRFSPQYLKLFESDVEKQFPKTIKFWPYGSTH